MGCRPFLAGVGDRMELTLIKNPALAKTYGQGGKGFGRGGNLRSSMAGRPAGKKGAPPAQTLAPIPDAPADQANKAADDGLIRVKLDKGTGGFGLRFGGPKNKAEGQQNGFGICISGIKSGSSAANSEN